MLGEVIFETFCLSTLLESLLLGKKRGAESCSRVVEVGVQVGLWEWDCGSESENWVELDKLNRKRIPSNGGANSISILKVFIVCMATSRSLRIALIDNLLPCALPAVKLTPITIILSGDWKM